MNFEAQRWRFRALAEVMPADPPARPDDGEDAWWRRPDAWWSRSDFWCEELAPGPDAHEVAIRWPTEGDAIVQAAYRAFRAAEEDSDDELDRATGRWIEPSLASPWDLGGDTLPPRFTPGNLAALVSALAPVFDEIRFLIHHGEKECVEIWLTHGEAFACRHPPRLRELLGYWDELGRRLPPADPIRELSARACASKIRWCVKCLEGAADKRTRLRASFGPDGDLLHDHPDDDDLGGVLVEAWHAVDRLEATGHGEAPPLRSLLEAAPGGARPPYRLAQLVGYQAAREKAIRMLDAGEHGDALELLTSIDAPPWYAGELVDLAVAWRALGDARHAESLVAEHAGRVRPYRALCDARALVVRGHEALARCLFRQLLGAPLGYGVAARVDLAERLDGDEQAAVLRDAVALGEQLRSTLLSHGGLIVELDRQLARARALRDPARTGA